MARVSSATDKARLLAILAVCAAWAAGWAEGAGGAEAGIRLAENGRSDYVIVLAAGAEPVERTAAAELQTHLLGVTGAKLEIRPEGEVPAGAPQIVLGQAARVRELLPALDVKALGPDAIVIKTVGRDLVLCGRPPRGTLYAVYTLLEDVVGCRWWTSQESFIPKKPTLVIPPQDTVYAPALWYREALYRDALEGVFAARSKCNGNANRVPVEYGGHYRFAGFVHTFYQLLPPKKYFAAHPQWYSEIHGKRTADHAQLCLTNDEMRKELVRNAIARLRAEQGAGLISISQNDWAGRCECPRCLAVEKEEGSPAGPLLRMVNAAAEEIGREFPEVLVETLAYQYTRKPPLVVRPRENVVVRLCSIECSFVEPLEGKQNAAFRSDIEAWSRIAPHLFIWDYTANFQQFILPHPNLRVLAPNIRFFVDHHAMGLFEEGDMACAVGDFVGLRAWLLAHLMWDPRRDPRGLIREFAEGYYGPAAPHLLAYLDHVHDAAERSGVYLRCYMPDTSTWLTPADMNRAAQLFDRAEAAVAGDPVLAARVRRERMPLEHAWLQRYDALRRTARRRGGEFLGPKDPAAACAAFVALGEKLHADFYAEGRPFAPYAASLRQTFRPPAPPPDLCRGLGEDDWVDAQDNRFRLARPGEWARLVEDPRASDKSAARMPGSHREWAVSWPIPEDMAGTAWHCYVVARCEAKAGTGMAMTMGIYDTQARRGVADRVVQVEEAAGPEYRVFDLGVHPLGPTMYAWVAPPQRPSEVTAVYVDRMFFIRQRDNMRGANAESAR